MDFQQMAEKGKTIDHMDADLRRILKDREIKQQWAAKKSNLEVAGLWSFTEKRDKLPSTDEGVLVPFLHSASVTGKFHGKFINGIPVNITNQFVSWVLHIPREETRASPDPKKALQRRNGAQFS